ncbi:MAG TPA: hypothetical protein VEA69_03815 [Tepidisphaeraceae bacterium]|nr:hypothetical protein [Tepidisphaeraceae bacterium]
MSEAADLTQKLKEQIDAGKIKFDSDDLRKQLLLESTGTQVTALARQLVLELAKTVGTFIKISSLVRSSGHHGSGRAVDVGNEDVAASLLPTVVTKVADWKIDEIIYDAGGATLQARNKWNYDQGAKHEYDATTLADHQNHIHFAVKAS